jgi:hypothetical protein
MEREFELNEEVQMFDIGENDGFEFVKNDIYNLIFNIDALMTYIIQLMDLDDQAFIKDADDYLDSIKDLISIFFEYGPRKLIKLNKIIKSSINVHYGVTIAKSFRRRCYIALRCLNICIKDLNKRIFRLLKDPAKQVTRVKYRRFYF